MFQTQITEKVDDIEEMKRKPCEHEHCRNHEDHAGKLLLGIPVVLSIVIMYFKPDTNVRCTHDNEADCKTTEHDIEEMVETNHFISIEHV